MKSLVMVLIILIAIPTAIPTTVADTGYTAATGFSVVSALWGTTGSTSEAGPGSVNVPLTLTLQYYYYNVATGVRVQLDLPQGFTDLNGASEPSAYAQADIASGTLLSLTYYLDISPSTKIGSYIFPMTITWGAEVSGSSVSYVSLIQQDYATVTLYGRVKLFYEAQPLLLTAGEVNVVSMQIINSGSGAASQVSTSASSTQSLSVLNVLPDITSLGPNASATVSLSLYVSPSSAGTPVSLPISFSYYDAYGVQKTSSQTLGFYIASLNAVSPVGFKVMSASLVPGTISNVTVVISNQGHVALKQLSVNVSPPTTVSVMSRFPVTLYPLQPNSTVQLMLPIFVPSALSGSALSISMIAQYVESSGNAGTTTQSLSFYVTPLDIVSPIGVSVTPQSLIAGHLNNLTIAISNSGNVPATALTASFSVVASQGAWLGSDSAQSSEILPGQNLTVKAQVYDSVTTAASLGLQVSLSYTYKGISTQETRHVGLLSRGVIDMALTGATILPSLVSPGQIVSVTLTIANLGTITASAVYAVAEFPAGFNAIGSGSSFVGDMAVDSPSTFTLSAYVSNSTSVGTHVIPVRIAFSDNLRSSLSKTLNITVQVASLNTKKTGAATGASDAPGAQLLTLAGPVAVASTIAGLVFIQVRRRRVHRMPM